MRRTRTLRAAVPAVVATGLFAVWAADPAWAQALGVDVWNLGRLEDKLRSIRVEEDQLAAEFDRVSAQHRVNDLVIEDVIEGRLPLPAAAGQMWAMNRTRAGYEFAIRGVYRGATPLARAADQIVTRAEHAIEDPARRAAVIARLRSEYATAFGE